jgi:hypothetical protein
VDDAARLLPHRDARALEKLPNDPQVVGGDLDAPRLAPGVGHPHGRKLEAAFDRMGRIGREILVVHAPALLHP